MFLYSESIQGTSLASDLHILKRGLYPGLFKGYEWMSDT